MMPTTSLSRCPPVDARGIEQCGEHDDGGGVLIVMKHRHFETSAQFVLDLEAAGAAMSSSRMAPNEGAMDRTTSTK